jgi:two-component system, OmpR family, response regulator
MRTHASQLNELRVLVVDDDVDSADLLRFLLEEQNVEVVSAYSTQEALSVLTKWTPNLLISDLAMPIHDGFSLVKSIRDRNAILDRQLTKIALTAYVNPNLEEQVEQAGFQMLFTKPLELEKLVQTVQTLMSC